MIHRTQSGNRGLGHLQSGIALVVSLVMLLATTLIGVTIARVTTLQERMAGNMRQQSVSFEGAESMLREGEAWLDAQTGKAARPDDVAPANCGTPPCDVLNDAPGPSDGDPLDPLAATTWDPGTQVRNGAIVPGTRNTQYYIQQRQVVPDSLTMNNTGVRVYYAVVGRARSEAGGEAILRSEFAVRY